MNTVLKDFAHLGTQEKLQLVEDLWDSIEQDAIPDITDETHQELLRRCAWSDANPGQGVTLAQVAGSLGVRL